MGKVDVNDPASRNTVISRDEESNMLRQERCSYHVKLAIAGSLLALFTGACLAVNAEGPPLVTDTKPVLDRLQGIGRWMMTNQSSAIFVEGYNERTLLALYEITHEQAWLEHVRAWVPKLLDLQKPDGYWGTGYGDVYLADTGSALGLLVNFYKYATPADRKRIDNAFQRYFHLVLVRGDTAGKPFVHKDGSLGVGFETDKAGLITNNLSKPYTIATALTGGAVFAPWYYIKGHDRDKQIAIKACHWILDTMAGPVPPDAFAQPGQIPYIFYDSNKLPFDPNNSAQLVPTNDAKAREELWKSWPYDTSAYAGEGFIAVWTYIKDDKSRQDLAQRVKPHIEWLLRTQNKDGSWAIRKSSDQARSHGVINLLAWYYHNVERDARIADAVRRYSGLLVDEERSRYLQVPGLPISTALAGRALAEIVKPGVDCNRWLDEK